MDTIVMKETLNVKNVILVVLLVLVIICVQEKVVKCLNLKCLTV